MRRAARRAWSAPRAAPPTPCASGSWSIDFYRRQARRYGADSGFTGRGYVILAITAAEERAAGARIAMQRAAGLDVRWVDAARVRRLIPAMTGATGFRGGSYVETDGWIDPQRNVRAYSLAMQRAGVDLRERTAFTRLRVRRGRVTGVETSAGTIATERVLLSGGPGLQRVAALAGARAWVGYARHQVVVTEPHPGLHADTTAMAFDMRDGIYWRPEEGGFLWGMSNPAESPGAAGRIDWDYLRLMERRLHRLVPVTRRLGIKKAWAATIEYTPDHQPLLEPLVLRDGDELAGASIASACGHGMMWGPAVSRIAADLALDRRARVVRRVTDFRMDRFDEHGRSPFVDPVALPFPVAVDE